MGDEAFDPGLHVALNPADCATAKIDLLGEAALSDP